MLGDEYIDTKFILGIGMTYTFDVDNCSAVMIEFILVIQLFEDTTKKDLFE